MAGPGLDFPSFPALLGAECWWSLPRPHLHPSPTPTEDHVVSFHQKFSGSQRTFTEISNLHGLGPCASRCFLLRPGGCLLEAN